MLIEHLPTDQKTIEEFSKMQNFVVFKQKINRNFVGNMRQLATMIPSSTVI